MSEVKYVILGTSTCSKFRISEIIHFEWRDNLFLFNTHIKIAMDIINPDINDIHGYLDMCINSEVD